MTREEVIKAYGWPRYMALVGRAVVILKEDRRLVGLDRLRAAIAREACTVAIGGPRRTFVPPVGTCRGGEVPHLWCDELVSACALRLRLGGFVERDGCRVD